VLSTSLSKHRLRPVWIAGTTKEFWSNYSSLWKVSLTLRTHLEWRNKDISFLWNTVVNMRFYKNEKLHPHLLFSISAAEACARSMRDD
jgi:hypothetical protein